MAPPHLWLNFNPSSCGNVVKKWLASFLNVSSRLAKQLIALIDRGAPTLRLSQKELAQMLGVSREFVSKQLAIWREAGIVELGRRHLTVRDERALEQLIVAPQRAPR